MRAPARLSKWLLTFGAPLVVAAGLYAAPFGGAPASTLDRARPGDGALDAPVPAVGELGGPSRPLSPAELEQWKRGRAVFDRDFHRSTGGGAPEMNGDSCRACHQDPVIGGSGPLELNVSRFGDDNGGAGPFTLPPGAQGLSKLRPPYAAGREEYTPTATYVFEQRQSPPLFGAGLIDSIPEAEILAGEDPTDADMDGVFGVARMVDVAGTPEVGRFGWKAQLPRLVDFTLDAMGAECGITTPDPAGRTFGMRTDTDPVGDPELAQTDVDDLVFFLANLAPPKPGGSTDPRRAQGELLFDTVGCATCHTPSLAGAGGPVPLFSDLLLHKVMPASYRGMAEDGAPAGVFRTPPLWGLRHSAPYLHDGRAETVEAAILGHFEEGIGARTRYLALTPGEKDALLHFLGDI